MTAFRSMSFAASFSAAMRSIFSRAAFSFAMRSFSALVRLWRIASDRFRSSARLSASRRFCSSRSAAIRCVAAILAACAANISSCSRF